MAEACNYSADADLLGFGVRLGTYLQALSAILNLKLDTDDAPGSAWVSLFSVVVIMALALKYVLQRTISNAMFIATAYIGWGQLLITPAVLLMPTIRCYKFLVALIYAAILFTCGLLLWYWASGFRRLETAACGATTAFFFAQVPAFGWFRYFNLAALGVVSALFLGLLALLMTSWRPAMLQRVNRPLTLGVSLVLFLVLMALGCELTLSWNGLTDIYSLNSTGQLVPLMAGIGAVTRDAYFWWARRRACALPPPAAPATRGGRWGGDSDAAVTAADAAALASPGYKHV